MPSSCTICGQALEDHDPNIRFRLPEPVLALPERELTPGTWMSHQDPSTSVMMQLPGVGAFVRVLLPVRLTGGSTVTYGVWLGIPPEDLQHVVEEWWAPTYSSLVLDGWVANDVPPWAILARPGRAVVRDADQTPYLDSSDDEELQRVLGLEWDHDEVMAALPKGLAQP